ncbi:hypothetical protein JOC27_001490 [Sporolactobacillus spathodeae]|uniref:Uncharacterized protein n=1 Tax=Sporolactobacillus spathodeae TaxID=1465502 RepID=A0ABS2Q8D0_9BACL|nr:hypothetical protein [Sporolactobacillus spathodeae]
MEGNFFKGVAWALAFCLPFWFLVIGLIVHLF